MKITPILVKYKLKAAGNKGLSFFVPKMDLPGLWLNVILIFMIWASLREFFCYGFTAHGMLFPDDRKTKTVEAVHGSSLVPILKSPDSCGCTGIVLFAHDRAVLIKELGDGDNFDSFILVDG